MNEPVDMIYEIINNPLLADSITKSISIAIKNSTWVHLHAVSVWSVFKKSLDLAIYDFETHKRAPLFKRLIEFGPLNPNDPPELATENGTILTDGECAACIRFIYYFMVNRFKGEIGELLALKPVLELIKSLQDSARLPLNLHLYWGDMVHVRSKLREGMSEVGHYVKGADGLLVGETDDSLVVHGIIEVKSYGIRKAVLRQVNRHQINVERGVKLGTTEHSPENISFPDATPVRILVGTSEWKLSRTLELSKNIITYDEPYGTPVESRAAEISPDTWKITLGWSREALEQAAYEMTFWYMAQVGARVYTKDNLPEGWEDMTKEQAGMNAIKMMLYYLPLRPLSENQEKLAVQLYNIYSFGYPLGLDHGRKRQMLWSEGGRLIPQKLRKKKKSEME